MAKKYVEVDVYDILDENGNPTGETLRYPVNPATGKSYLTPESGSKSYVYKPNKSGEEEYVSTKNATASIEIDPIQNTITVTGPKWLTSEIVNSDDFKKNYSENSALASAMSLYRKDPNSKYQTTDGQMRSAADVIAKYQSAASSYGSSAGQLAAYKKAKKEQFGVDFSDEDVAIATNFVNKNDYKGNEAITVPKDLIKRFDWEQFGSWDAEHETVSAEDFFNNIYKISLTDNSIEQLQADLLQKIKTAYENNIYDRNDEEAAAKKAEELGSAEYASELAKNIQMYNLVTQNKPDATAAYNFVSFNASVLNGFLYYANTGIRNVAQGLAESAQLIPKLASMIDGDESPIAQGVEKLNKAASFYWNFLGPESPLLMSAFFAGEITNAVSDFNSSKEFNEVIDSLMADVESLYNSDLGGRYAERRAEFEALKEDIDSRRAMINGWWSAGDFVGYLGYKIAENVVLLNPTGEAVGSAMSTALTAKGFAKVAGKVMSEKQVASLIKVVSKMTNVTAQALFETLIDDREVVDKWLSSGEFGEAWEKYMSNWMGNAFGEMALPAGKKVGKKVGLWLAERSTIAKFFYTGANKLMSGVNYLKYGATARFFAALNGVHGKNVQEKLAEALLKNELNGNALSQSKRLALFNVAAQYARRDMAKNIWNIPLLKEIDESLVDVTNASYGFVLGGQKFLEATTGEAAQKAIQEGVEACMDKATKEVAEQIAKESKDVSTLVGKDLDEKMTKKYRTMRKQILLRANLENQLDQITKGARLQFNRMLRYAQKEWDDFSQATARVGQLEAQAVKEGKITRFGKGTVLGKQDSEYISLRTQLGRYKWKMDKVEEAGGDWKKAFHDDGETRIFKSKKEFDEMAEYAKVQEARFNQLKELFGEDLCKALDDLHESAGRLHMKIVNFMGEHNYMTEEEFGTIMRLAKNQGWGENGERYLPTTRLESDEDIELGFRKGNAWMSAENRPARKMLTDGVKELQPGDAKPFGDPVANLMAWIQTQCRVAQAQEYGRALHAVSAPLRAAKGYDMNGLSKYDASIMENTLKDTKKDFVNALRGKTANAPYGYAIIDAVENSNVYNIGLLELDINTKGGAKNLADREQAANKLKKKIDRGLTSEQSLDAKDIQNKSIEMASAADLDDLIRNTVDANKIPKFNPADVSAAEFEDWLNAMPDSRKYFAQKLSGQKLNITNVRKLAKQDTELVTNLKRNYINKTLRKESSFKNSTYYKNFLFNQYSDSVMIRRNTVLSSDIKEYNRMMKSINATKEKLGIEVAGEDFGNEFIMAVDDMRNKLIENLGDSMAKNKSFREMVDRLVNEGVDEDVAKRYTILSQLNEQDAKELMYPLVRHGYDTNPVAKGISGKVMGKHGTKHYEEVSDIIGKTLKSTIETDLNVTRNAIAEKVSSELLDNKTYFDALEKEMQAIEDTYLFRAGDESSALKTGRLNQAQRRRIVELIDENGTLRFYETDPLYAALTNEPVGNYSVEQGFLGKAYHTINRIFRFGTTGIDRKSYVNQWVKDTTDAAVLGAYTPFIDLSTGGLASRVASMYHDMGLPFGKKVFGKFATDKITDEVVESVYESAKQGIIDEFGQEWFDNFAKEAVGDLTGEEAEIAVKRATAQFAVGDLGYNQLPGLGASTRAEFFRGTAKGEVEEVAPSQISKERAEIIYNNADAYKETQSKLLSFIDERLDELQKGSFRETMLRKGVYTSQYRAGIESGMTHKEAEVWATRYALDATTNFNRTFMWGNRFIKSVPYLGAAINGMKSFWRLLEMDPVGVTKRFVFGLALPYARMLSTCLSSEENRKAYSNLREYEKSGSLAFVWHGTVVTIPAPESLSKFLAPFRHVVEKAADVQDHTWFELALSDTLGILPLDMSGFVDLDANEFLADEENGFGHRIERGTEKMLSSLMSPITSTAWMMAFKRDPYTGRNIVTTRVVVNEEGEISIMDSSQSDLANWIGKTFNVSATGAYECLKSLFGRSTVTVLDGAYDVLNGSFSITDSINQALGEYMSPLEASKYDKVRQDWNRAINEAYDRREKLVNDAEFQKAFQVMTDKNYSEEKREDARRLYNEKLDEYSSFVLDIFKTMKANHPEQYTDVRAAQAISLLTLPQSLAYSETAQDAEVRQDSYYSARNMAINTFLSMGFPADTVGNNMLGTGYYDKYGKYQFKVFTPYQIEALNSTVLGTNERVQAEIRAAIKANIDKSKMWDGYYAANTKADRKAYEEQWNAQVVQALYPTIQKYGIETVLNSGDTVDVLDNYLFIDNPFKAKQYLRSIFGGD